MRTLLARTITATLMLAFALALLPGQSASPAWPQLIVQAGFSSPADSIAVAPGEQWFITSNVGSGGGSELQMFLASTLTEVRDTTLPTGANGLLLSPDGATLALQTGSQFQTELWDVNNWKSLQTLPGMQMPLAFSPDGHWLATGASSQLQLWQTGTWTPRPLPLPAGDSPTRAVFSRDGRFLAVAAARPQPSLPANQTAQHLLLFEVADGKLVYDRERSGNYATALGLDASGSALVLADTTGQVSLHDLATGALQRSLPPPAPLQQARAALDPRGNWLISFAPFQPPIVVNLNTGATQQLPPGSPDLMSAAFLPGGSALLATSTRPLLRARLPDLSVTGSVGVSTDQISSLNLSPDGHWLTTALSTFEPPAPLGQTVMHSPVRLWDLTAAGAMQRVELPNALNAGYAALTAAGGQLLVGADFNLQQVDVTSGQLSPLESGANPVAQSVDGRTLVMASGIGGRNLQLWDRDTRKPVASLAVPAGDPHFLLAGVGVLNAAVSNDRRWLALAGSAQCGSETCIELYDIAHLGAPALVLSSWVQRLRGAMQFTPDSRRLIVATGAGLRAWDAATGAPLAVATPPGGDDARVFALSADSQWLAAAGSAIHFYRLDTLQPVGPAIPGAGAIAQLQFSRDGRWLFTGSNEGTIQLWEQVTRTLRATLIPLHESGDWLIFTPEGLFDGTPAAWRTIYWRFSNRTLDIAPVEIFFQDFYRPGLLNEILAGGHPLPAVNVAAVDRRQPAVTIAISDAAAPASTRMVHLTLHAQQAPPDTSHPSAGSGVQELRLLRNGSLVRVWHGALPLSASGQVTETADVPIVAGSNQFTAYAFSDANIKSADAQISVTGALSLARPATAYVLAIGINDYAQRPLNFAVPDANDFLNAVAAGQQAQKFAHVVVIPLLDRDATRAKILAALARLQSAQPEDAVFLYYAGHGIASADHFYLVPADANLSAADHPGSPAAGMISDTDLAQAFEHIDASHFILVVDACESGRAIETGDTRPGPMNSKGLAQLAYDKGMFILTASRGTQSALELSRFGHGLLTYALVEEGLKTNAAAVNGAISVGPWFDFAAREVPALDQKYVSGASDAARSFALGPQPAQIQRPRAFYRRDPDAVPFIVAPAPYSRPTTSG